LVGPQPDTILTDTTPATVAVQRETRTIPIVFANVSDPVASGIVPRLDRPSGNATGFATDEASMGSKWLELLSEIASGHDRPWARAGRRPCCHAGSIHVRASRADHIGGGPKQSTGGLCVFLLCQRRRFALIRTRPGAASYVDRILRGARPGDLPVQFPTKFEMVVNRKTATALGLAIPPSIMLRASEIIE
jgi:putative ABC transport system substrate-binding protein